MKAERGKCCHCGRPLRGLGVITTVHPHTNTPIGLAVCHPAGRDATVPFYEEPSDCWALVKFCGYELGLPRRSLAEALQADDFDAELDRAIEEMSSGDRGEAEGSAPA